MRDPRDVNPIDLNPDARAALLEQIGDATDSGGFVFLNRRGRPFLARDIARGFAAVVKQAGLPETQDGPVTFHALRHTALSRLANHPQIALVYVRDYAGHSNLRTTETYVHRIGSAEMTAAAALALSGAGTSAARSDGTEGD